MVLFYAAFVLALGLVQSDENQNYCLKDSSVEGCKKLDILEKLELIRKDCGEVCDTSIKPVRLVFLIKNFGHGNICYQTEY